MPFRTYQPIAEAPKTPPLRPPFVEGWQEDSRGRAKGLPPPPARTIVHDEQSSSTILRSLSFPLPEGWQSDRAVIRPVARTTPHDEQQSTTLLSTPPLASPFKEGWQTDRATFQVAFVKARESQWFINLSILPPIGPSATEGWQPERRVLLALRATFHDEQSSSTLLARQPLSPAFKEGWQPQDVKARRVIPRNAVTEQLFFAVPKPVAQTVIAWETQDRRPQAFQWSRQFKFFDGDQSWGPIPVFPRFPLLFGRPFLPRVPNFETAHDLARLRRFTELVQTLVNSLFSQGSLVSTGVDTYAMHSGGYALDRSPTTNDDSSVGVLPGVSWVNTATNDVYINAVNTVGAAVWVKVS